MNNFNLDETLNAYEAGLLTSKCEIEMFAFLIQTGEAWNLPQHYGHRAAGYIDAGILADDGTILWKLKGN